MANGGRKHLDPFAIGAMITLCAIWGMHQVVIKAAAPDIAPIMQIALRSAISAVLVGLVMAFTRVRISLRDPTLGPGLLVGTVFAVEFIFIAEGLRFTSASHMAVFLYTAPIFTALALQWFIPAERLRPRQWVGIGIAFGGIAVAFIGSSVTGGMDMRMLWGDILGILAGAGWGFSTVIIRCSKLSDAPATKTLLYQLIMASLLLLVYGLISGQAGNITMTRIAWASILFQGFIITFATYLAWFSLLRRYLASRLSVFTFLSPLFGVFFGVLLLHEEVGLHFGFGAVMVLVGIFIVSRKSVPEVAVVEAAGSLERT